MLTVAMILKTDLYGTHYIVLGINMLDTTCCNSFIIVVGVNTMYNILVDDNLFL